MYCQRYEFTWVIADCSIFFFLHNSNQCLPGKYRSYQTANCLFLCLARSVASLRFCRYSLLLSTTETDYSFFLIISKYEQHSHHKHKSKGGLLQCCQYSHRLIFVGDIACSIHCWHAFGWLIYDELFRVPQKDWLQRIVWRPHIAVVFCEISVQKMDSSWKPDCYENLTS